MVGGERVLVVAPMASEMRPVVRRLRARRKVVGGAAVHAADREGRSWFIARLGVGPERAAARTRALLEALQPALVLVSGIAGGIDGVLPVGTLVVPDEVVDLESGQRFRPAPLDPGSGGRLASGEAYVERTIGTTATLVLDDERLSQFAARGIAVVDMETAAVAAECDRRGVSWRAFRVVSDRPQDGLVDQQVMSLLQADGSANPLKALGFIVTHPRRVPGLVRLGRDSSAAATLAAQAAVASVT